MDRSRDIHVLLEIMRALRDPAACCAWDIRQTFGTIAPHTIEEAYEVADAVERGNLEDLKDELGDLLLQVAFHARIAEEQGAFDFGAVVDAITHKLIRRHPHVFGSKRALSPERVKASWDEIKTVEKRERAARRGERPERLLDGIPTALPALTRAVKLQTKAGTVGFDWNDARLVLDKIQEETKEVGVALDEGDQAAILDELGDLLFAVANLARHAGVDPEAALRAGNAKFERRFAHIEDRVIAEGRTLTETSLAAMEALWIEAKQRERA